MRSVKLRALFLLSAGALATQLHAQDLPPELLPTATKYRADTAALSTQQKAALDRVAQVYGTALDTAEKAETSAGRVAAIGAITQERADLKKNELKTESLGNLPKGLHAARKTYFDGIARVTADFEQRQQRLTSDYLRVLSALQTRAGSNSELARQVNDEKDRVLAITATMGNAAVLGKWITSVPGWQGWRILNANGSVTCNDDPPAKWRIVGSILRLTYTNGVVEELILPVRDGKLRGKSNRDGRDVPLTATKAPN
jgi:hypothetical protein